MILQWRLYSEQTAGVVDAQALNAEPSRPAQVPLFASITPGELTSVARRVGVERYKPGVTIVRQGESADRMFLIAEGRVEVLAEVNGEARRIKTLGPGSYFGEMALVGDASTRRTATVRAVAPCELYSLHKNDFLALLRSQPGLAKAVSRLARMRATQTRRAVGTADGRERGNHVHAARAHLHSDPLAQLARHSGGQPIRRGLRGFG